MQNEKRKEVYFSKRWIQIRYQTGYYTRIKVEREGKLIKPQDYKEGDILYVLKYHKKANFLRVNVYEIVNKGNEYVTKEINKYQIWCVNEIYCYNFSEELQNQILNLYKYGRC